MTVEEQEASIIYGFSSVTNLRAVIARSAGTASVGCFSFSNAALLFAVSTHVLWVSRLTLLSPPQINFLYSRGFGFNMGVPGMEARFYEVVFFFFFHQRGW